MKRHLIRKAIAAGTWYPEDPDLLLRVVENLLIDFRPEDETTCDATAVILPHSTFAYAAETVCRTLAQIEIPDRVLFLHTRHIASDLGPTLSPFTIWETPLAQTKASASLCQAVLDAGIAVEDEETHAEDHAAEVLLPFFQVLNKDVEIAAVSIPPMTAAETLVLGDRLTALLKNYDEDLLLVIATDLNHFGDRRKITRLDDLILERVEFLDAEGLLRLTATNSELNFFGTTHLAAVIHAAKCIGCDEVLIVHHTDSGESDCEIDEVIGFASGFLR